jgi:hypothetical protein
MAWVIGMAVLLSAFASPFHPSAWRTAVCSWSSRPQVAGPHLPQHRPLRICSATPEAPHLLLSLMGGPRCSGCQLAVRVNLQFQLLHPIPCLMVDLNRARWYDGRGSGQWATNSVVRTWVILGCTRDVRRNRLRCRHHQLGPGSWLARRHAPGSEAAAPANYGR